MSIYLIRHGITDWNESNRAQGHTDIPLNALGMQQVAHLGPAFRGIPIGQILCSDLVRAKDTAAPILAATGAPIEYLPQLRERSFGKWEGDPYSDIHARMTAAAQKLDIEEFFVRPDDGESQKDVWDRTDKIYHQLASSKDNICVVTHGGVCAILLARLLQGTYDTPQSFGFMNASITQLDQRPNGAWKLMRFSDVSHLQGIDGEGS